MVMMHAMRMGRTANCYVGLFIYDMNKFIVYANHYKPAAVQTIGLYCIGLY